MEIKIKMESDRFTTLGFAKAVIDGNFFGVNDLTELCAYLQVYINARMYELKNAPCDCTSVGGESDA